MLAGINMHQMSSSRAKYMRDLGACFMMVSREQVVSWFFLSWACHVSSCLIFYSLILPRLVWSCFFCLILSCINCILRFSNSESYLYLCLYAGCIEYENGYKAWGGDVPLGYETDFRVWQVLSLSCLIFCLCLLLVLSFVVLGQEWIWQSGRQGKLVVLPLSFFCFVLSSLCLCLVFSSSCLIFCLFFYLLINFFRLFVRVARDVLSLVFVIPRLTFVFVLSLPYLCLCVADWNNSCLALWPVCCAHKRSCLAFCPVLSCFVLTCLV